MYATARDTVAALEKSRGSVSAQWVYTDGRGEPVGVVVRWDNPQGKNILPVSLNSDRSGWVCGGMPVPRPLYGLPTLSEAGCVFVVEGEKCADALAALGLIATTSPHGSKSAAKADWVPLAAKDVVIVPDNDDPGRRYADDVAALLTRLSPPPTVKLLALPDIPSGGDAVEYVEAQRTAGLDDDAIRTAIEHLANEAQDVKPIEVGTSDPPRKSGAKPKQGRGPSQATILVDLSLGAGVELFHSPAHDDESYATVPIDGHVETRKIASRAFRDWLASVYYQVNKAAPGAQALQDASNVLRGQARFEGPARNVAVRIAEHEGAYWLDLANGEWQAVRISADGWRVVDNPSARFIRPRGVLPLPKPVDGGSVDELRQVVNVPNDADWILVKAYMLSALCPRGPFPVLVVAGEQGSCKSSLSRFIRETVDPNKAVLRSEPREIRDLIIAAENGWLVAFDNISVLPPWTSDALSRLSTGAGFGARQLYSDDEERLFSAMRPILLNGITEVATRSDLLDRAICVDLPQLADVDRRTEGDLRREYETMRPRVLGSLLTALSEAMANLPRVRLATLPRMADFAKLAVAGSGGLNTTAADFEQAYSGNRDSINQSAIEGAIVGPPILAMVAAETMWTGTARELLAKLTEYASEKTRETKGWPQSPRGVSGKLRRIAPNLRQSGIAVDFHAPEGRGNVKRITVTRRHD